MLSIVIALYNKETTILRTLKSVLDYVSVEFELIIVNDCSTDSSFALTEKFLRNSVHKYELVDLEKNIGRSEARNIGIAHANHEYILFLDADDYLSEGFKKITDYCRPNRVITFNYIEIKRGGFSFCSNRFSLSKYYNPLFLYSLGVYLPSCSSTIVPRDIAMKIKFNNEYHAGEDLLYWLTIQSLGYSFYHVNLNGSIYNNYSYDSASRNDIDQNLLTALKNIGFSFYLYGLSILCAQRYWNTGNIGSLILEKMLRCCLAIRYLMPHLIRRFMNDIRNT